VQPLSAAGGGGRSRKHLGHHGGGFSSGL